MDKISNIIGNIKTGISKALKKAKKVIRFLTFLVSNTIGHILGIIILIIMLIVFTYILITTIQVTIRRAGGTDLNSAAVRLDKEYSLFKDATSYDALLKAEDMKDYMAYEYAVLMDTARCIEESGVYELLEYRLYNLEELEGYSSADAAAAHYKGEIYTPAGKTYENEAGFQLGIGGEEQIKYRKELSKQNGEAYADSATPETLIDEEKGKESESYAGEIYYKAVENEYLYEQMSINTSAELEMSLLPYLKIDQTQWNLYYIIETENNEVPTSVSEKFYPLMYVKELNKNNKNLWESFSFQSMGEDDTSEINADEESREYSLYEARDNGSRSFTHTYEVSLKVLVDRYLPKATLLAGWHMLKENQDGSTNNTTGDTTSQTTTANTSGASDTATVINKLIEDIKHVYNMGCLTSLSIDGEGSETEENIHEDADNAFGKYTADSNKYSWINFSRTVLEMTRFGEWKSNDPKKTGEDTLYTIYDLWTAFEVFVNYSYIIGYDENGNVVIGSGTAKYAGDIPGIEYAVGAEGAILETKINTPAPWILPPQSVPLSEDCEMEEGNYEYKYVTQADGYYKRMQAKSGNLAVRERGEYGLSREQYDHIMQNIVLPEGATADSVMTTIEQEDQEHKTATFPINKRNVKVTQNILYRFMPAYFINNMESWAKSSKFKTELQINRFKGAEKDGKSGDPRYIISKNKKARGITDIIITEIPRYRLDMYRDVFTGDEGQVRENDVLGMLIEWEKTGSDGDDSSYTNIRDLYNLIMYSKEEGIINEDSYTYVYVPEEIIEYDEPISQVIFWTERLALQQDEDRLTLEEELTMRGKNPVITWQEVEYDEYPECNGKVFCLYPLGSAMVRSFYELASDRSGSIGTTTNGTTPTSSVPGTGITNYNWGWFGGATSGHQGVDWFGRNLMKQLNNYVQQKGGLGSDGSISIEEKGPFANVGSDVYNYEVERIKEINPYKAETIVNDYVEEQTLFVPVVASAPGIVTDVRFNGTSGFRVKIQHELNENGEPYGYNEGTSTFYMHMKRWPLVQEGDYVGAGTVLGYEGTTGGSGTYHVHYEVHKDGEPQDPTLYAFPIFNPFYYEEKYGNGPEYRSLARTVLLENASNRVPQTALLDSTDKLVTIESDYEYEIDKNMSKAEEISENNQVGDIGSLKLYFNDGVQSLELRGKYKIENGQLIEYTSSTTQTDNNASDDSQDPTAQSPHDM